MLLTVVVTVGDTGWEERVMSEGKRRITIELPTCSVLSDAVSGLKESEVAKHVRGIQREMLLTMRSVIDAGIACLEEDKEEAKPKQEKKADAQ